MAMEAKPESFSSVRIAQSEEKSLPRFGSDALSSPISPQRMPRRQRMMACEVAEQKEMISMSYTHAYTHQFAETINFKQQNILSVSLSDLPKLSDAGSSFYFCKSPYSSINTLLDWARNDGECHLISKADLNYVVRCFNYDFLVRIELRSDRRKAGAIAFGHNGYVEGLKKQAIRVLSYIAQHRRELPENALTALIVELKNQTEKEYPNPVNLNVSDLRSTFLFNYSALT